MARRPISGNRAGRRPPGTIGQERQYSQVLQTREAAGEIVWWRYEGITLILSYGGQGRTGQRYTPDFAVQLADGTMELHEVKGFADEKNVNKIKVAADLYPFRFVLVRRQTKKEGGGWTYREL